MLACIGWLVHKITVKRKEASGNMQWWPPASGGEKISMVTNVFGLYNVYPFIFHYK